MVCDEPSSAILSVDYDNLLVELLQVQNNFVKLILLC